MSTDYSRQLHREYERVTLKAEELERNNRELKAENRELRQRVSELESTLEERIARAVDNAVSKAVAPLNAKIAVLEAAIEVKDKEILRLKSQIDKNSGNSSKPPSSNGLKPVVNSREPSVRKQGGQKGHKGYGIKLPENLDELVRQGQAKKTVVDHTDGSVRYRSVWKIDVEVVVSYTEHRYPLEAREPAPPPRVVYGDKLKAMLIVLSVEGIVALERISAFTKEITGGLVSPCRATVEQIIEEFADRIKPGTGGDQRKAAKRENVSCRRGITADDGKERIWGKAGPTKSLESQHMERAAFMSEPSCFCRRIGRNTTRCRSKGLISWVQYPKNLSGGTNCEGF
jgi:hypothetical protein